VRARAQARAEYGRVAAALRALAQVGDPRADLASGLLTEREAGALSVLYGQGATDRVVLERALGMEAQLRKLASVGTDPVRLPPRPASGTRGGPAGEPAGGDDSSAVSW